MSQRTAEISSLPLPVATSTAQAATFAAAGRSTPNGMPKPKPLSTAAADGFFGMVGKPKILTYSPGQTSGRTTHQLSVIFGARDLTIFQRPEMLWRSSLFGLYTLFIGLVFRLGDGQQVAVELMPLFLSGASQLRDLLGFVLAGFAGASVTAWYRRRHNYAAFCGNVRNTCLQLASLLPDADESCGMADARRAMARWVILAHELGMLKARGAMDSEEARAFLLRVELLREGEWEAMVPGDRHTSTLFWVQALAKQLNSEGRLSDIEVYTISSAVSGLRAQANDLMSSLDRDLPYPYAHIVSFVLHTWFFLVTSANGLSLAANMPQAFSGRDVTSWAQSDGRRGTLYAIYVVQVLCTTFIVFCFKGLLELQEVLHHPFGNRRIDAAHEVISAGLRKLAESIVADRQRFLPPTIRARTSPSPRENGSAP